MQDCTVVGDQVRRSIDARIRERNRLWRSTVGIQLVLNFLPCATRSKLPLESYLNAHKSLAFVRCNGFCLTLRVSNFFSRSAYRCISLLGISLSYNDFVIRPLHHFSNCVCATITTGKDARNRSCETELSNYEMNLSLTFYKSGNIFRLEYI